MPEPLRRFERLTSGHRLASPRMCPVSGKPYPRLVPAVDQDGNEVCGIRLPFQTVPLATHTGWNLRHPDIGGAGQTLASGGASGGTLIGATIPFPATREARQATGDPRRSIAERYTSKADYLEQVRQAPKPWCRLGISWLKTSTRSSARRRNTMIWCVASADGHHESPCFSEYYGSYATLPFTATLLQPARERRVERGCSLSLQVETHVAIQVHVILILLCPNIVCTTLGDTPCSSIHVAKVWRASCRRMAGTPARLSARRKRGRGCQGR